MGDGANGSAGDGAPLTLPSPPDGGEGYCDLPLPAGEGRGEGRPHDNYTWITSKPVVRARELRRRPTDAESLLWRRLRRREVGVKFRRQHPVGGFIADFYCDEARLVVEVDGGGHAEAGVGKYDAGRTAELERMGIKVLRFWNTDVLTNIEGVLEVIAAAARQRG